MILEDQFTDAMLGLYRRTGEATGYWARYFLREVRKKRGLAVARRLLQSSRGISEGFDKLVAARRADLSVEALVLQEPYRGLFSPVELDEARQRLEKLPRSAFPLHVDPAFIYPDSLPPDQSYLEGAVRSVPVNAYERDPRARKACIRYHGTRCSVCNIDFGERYGPFGAGFIHVHHKRPLGLWRKEYRLNPITDLIPVCPNCHAMLHAFNPPLDVEELRARYLAPGEIAASDSGPRITPPQC